MSNAKSVLSIGVTAVMLGFCALLLHEVLVAGPPPLRSSTAPLPQGQAWWGRYAHVPDWRRAERIDRDASAYFLRHIAGDLAAQGLHAARAGVTAGDPRAHVSVVPVPYWQALAPSARPARHTANGAHIGFAARGESEPLALAVRQIGDHGRVRFVAVPSATDSACPAAADVSFRLLLPYPARDLGGRRPAALRVQPMLVLASPDNSWDLAPEQTVMVVADVHVPVRAPAGRCRLAIEVRRGDTTVHVERYAFDILPFRLRSNAFHVGAFGVTHDQWAGGFTGYYPEMIEMDSRYGFNLAGGFFNKGDELPFVRRADGRLQIDQNDPRFARFDLTMRRLRAHGMGDLAFWNWGASGNVTQFNNVLAHAGIAGGIETAAGKRGFADMLAAIKDAEQRHGWPEIVVNPYDEALKDQDATRELIAAMEQVRHLSPRSRVYMTAWRAGYTRHYQSSGRHLSGDSRPRAGAALKLRLSGERPRRNFHVIGANTLDDEGRALQDLLGGEYWHYTGAERLGAEARFAFGFRPWIQRSESVLLWANYHGDLRGRGWTLHHVLPRDPNGRAHRDTRGPVLAGAKAYVVREGIDDRLYLETLRYHAARCAAPDADAFLRQLATRARALLLNPDEIGGLHNVEGQISDGHALQDLRRELKDRILAARALCRAPRTRD